MNGFLGNHFDRCFLILVETKGNMISRVGLLFLLVCSTSAVLGQRYTVKGNVIDQDGNSLPGVNIISLETGFGVSSDVNGYYEIELPRGVHHLEASFVGMETLEKYANATRNLIINFKLKPAIVEMDAFVKTGRQEDYRIAEIPGVERLTISAIQDVPLLMGEVDIISSITLLPGVTTAGEGASGFNVRGGKVDQNLILLNGGEIFNSSHLLGFFSIFNSDVVEDFTLYKGHIPASFGGRLSSVLDVNLREGDQQSWAGGLTAGVVTSKFFVEGPIAENKLSVLAAGRFAYPNFVMHQIADFDVRQSDARFDDQNVSASYRINDNNKVTLSFYRSFDRFRFSNDFQFDWSTILGNVKVQNYLGENWLHELEVSRVAYNNKQVDLIQDFAVDNGISFSSIHDSFLYEGWSGHELRAGVEWKFYEQTPEERIPGITSGFSAATIEKDQGDILSFYVSDDWTIAEKLNLSVGFRYNQYRQTGDAQEFIYREGAPLLPLNIVDTTNNSGTLSTYSNFEPRIGLNYRITPRFAIKASYNQIAQYVHLISNSASPTPVDVWQVSTAYIEPQLSTNYSGGITYQGANKKWQISVDGFYRDIANVYEYRDFANLILNPHLETELVQSKGKAYGAELLVEKSKDGWTGWFSYTWSISRNRTDSPFEEDLINRGDWYPSNFDQRHNFSLVLNRQFGRNGFFSFNTIFRSGRPFTALVTNYSFNDVAVPVYSERNQFNIPNYFRIDIGIGTNNFIKTLDDRLSFSVYNLLGRDNAYSIYYQFTTQASILPHSYRLSVLGNAFPSLTYTINFSQKDEF